MDKVIFSVNGERCTLAGTEVNPTTSLNDYLRNYLNLNGTKAMCHEGGCGACVVSVSQPHPSTKEKHVFAVNSCLVHILSCHGWDIKTVEGLGNRRVGYHSLQNRLASLNGTQCGYCTPGMIMNMYSLSESTSELTMKEVENSFGGNLCRCTGYRPILDSFKSFAKDVDPQLKSKIQDLEDLDQITCLKKRKLETNGDLFFIENEDKSLKDVAMFSGRWYKVYSIDDVFKVLSLAGSDSYAIVAGNTGQGIYPYTKQPKIFIDISSIEDLKEHRLVNGNLVLGAGMSITDTMALFKKWGSKGEFSYLNQFYDHLDLVAHVPVRNLGTLGGNLAMKNMHNDFPSDIFLLLKTVGATVTLVNSSLQYSVLKMEDFMTTDLKTNLIQDIKLPPLSKSDLVRTYKIMPRAQNAHAIVNAGFLFKVDSKQKILECNLVFGNINPTFINAKKTERKLIGNELFSDATLQKAIEALKEEIVPIDLPPEPSVECRKTLSLGLFYKAILSLAPETSVNPRYKSGGSLLQRELSRGSQTYDTDKSLWPLNQPVRKLEALSQCSGEADYVGDVTESKPVHVAFVLSDIYRGEIEGFDASEALKLPGVIAFYSAKDIPGKNAFSHENMFSMTDNEEVLATTVSYYGQPIGLIAAATQKSAVAAARLVKTKYKKCNEKIVLTIREALAAPDKKRRMRLDVNRRASVRGTDVTHTFTGSFTTPSQYHFTMETQSCTVSNTPLGVKVRSATQWMDLVQATVGDVLGINNNQVEVEVPRLGGGYGGKCGPAALTACACAIVAYKLNRTATLVLPLTDNMAAIGKRQEFLADYEVGTNNEGQIQYLNVTYFSDSGWNFNENVGNLSGFMATLYDTSNWNIKGYSVLTDKPCMTWCRSPGTTESTAFVEHIMETIAFETKTDPVAVRLQHLSAANTVMRNIAIDFKNDCNYDERQAEIAKFNKDNAWKKRAIKLGLMAYPIEYFFAFSATISIYHLDGTITISHGGIEMGQGINTKVAQVCAYTLKVPLSKVNVRSSNSFISPNNLISGGSVTSESIAYATIKACEELLRRLEPLKKDLNEPTWEEVVQAAYNKDVNLQASYMMSPNENLKGYSVYGVCVSEVELDVLTGNHLLRRVDLVEDTGISMSPDIDIGQIEGAFIMGLGLWTTEDLKYDPTSGRLLTNNTWTYKPPGVKDIPTDFRISFRRNSPNTAGVLRSKATGEPALVLAVTVAFALNEAILEARKEFGYNDTKTWLQVEAPFTVENILKAISPKTEYYKIK